MTEKAKAPKVEKTKAAPKPKPAAMPHQGGSFIAEPDGTLNRVEHTQEKGGK